MILCNEYKKSIGILGAGMSGLYLAKKIKEYNSFIEVIIYEETDKLGGKFRLENGYLIGAEQVHYKNYSFYNYIQNLLKIKNIDINKVLIKLNEPIIISNNKNIQNSDYIEMINNLDYLSDDIKTIFLCHEYSMELEDIDKDALNIEISNLDKKLGTESYIITKTLYNLIINDLTDNIKIEYLYDKNNIKNHDLIVNAYVPNEYLKYLNPAIKIFFKNKKLLKIYNISNTYLYCKDKNISVCELWRNEDYFTIFATSSRSVKLNNLNNFELKFFIKNMIKDIFNCDIIVKKVYKKYWINSYHYPNMTDKNKFKKNKYSCGEWLSPIFDASLNSAINSAEDVLKELINDKII